MFDCRTLLGFHNPDINMSTYRRAVQRFCFIHDEWRTSENQFPFSADPTCLTQRYTDNQIRNSLSFIQVLASPSLLGNNECWFFSHIHWYLVNIILAWIPRLPTTVFQESDQKQGLIWLGFFATGSSRIRSGLSTYYLWYNAFLFVDSIWIHLNYRTTNKRTTQSAPSGSHISPRRRPSRSDSKFSMSSSHPKIVPSVRPRTNHIRRCGVTPD